MPLRICFQPRKQIFWRPGLPCVRFFHSSLCSRQGTVNHYEALSLESDASSGEIKKLIPEQLSKDDVNKNRQFYALSKLHHPDRNPHDPKASERFMKVSEAYAILGTPHKREEYDRQYLGQRAPPPQARRGSYSSSTSPYGGRPASGLSRRKGHFRGPPPSFFRNGGWGPHSEKRQAQADAFARAQAQAASTKNAGETGNDYDQAVFSNEVPHFDQRAHLRTQQQQEQRRQQRLHAQSVAFEERGGTLIRFLLLSGIVGLACTSLVSFRGPDISTTQDMKKQQK